MGNTRRAQRCDTADVEAGVAADALRFYSFFRSVVGLFVVVMVVPAAESVRVHVARVGESDHGSADGVAGGGDVAGFELLGVGEGGQRGEKEGCEECGLHCGRIGR